MAYTRPTEQPKTREEQREQNEAWYKNNLEQYDTNKNGRIDTDELQKAAPPEGYTEYQWNNMSALERAAAFGDPWYNDPESQSHSSQASSPSAGALDANGNPVDARRTLDGDTSAAGQAARINEYYRLHGEYPPDIQAQMDASTRVGGAGSTGSYGVPQYAGPINFPAQGTPEWFAMRGGKMSGMDYSRGAPSPVARPQGRNSQLPLYGSDPFLPTGGPPQQTAMMPGPQYQALTTMALPPAASRRPTQEQTASPAGGRTVATGVQQASQQAQMPGADSEQLAQQQALAQMALPGAPAQLQPGQTQFRPPGW